MDSDHAQSFKEALKRIASDDCPMCGRRIIDRDAGGLILRCADGHTISIGVELAGLNLQVTQRIMHITVRAGRGKLEYWREGAKQQRREREFVARLNAPLLREVRELIDAQEIAR